MPFVKGQEKKGGRGVGAVNAKTKQWEALGDSIITEHAERFNAILEHSDDENFQRYFMMILEYFKPKQARTEVSGKLDTTVTVKFTDAS
jgi:hypothetical protein